MQCRFPRVPSILLLGLVYMAYVLIGGAVFWKLEGDVVQQDVSQILEKKAKILRGYPCIDQDGLGALAEMIISASKAGLSLKGNFTRDGFWKFTSSAVFAATVVTTIGYGNISPSTTYGQIFCVFFALIGIPLNLVVLNRVGKYMLAIEGSACDFVERKTNRKKCSRYLIRLVSYLSGAGLFFILPMMVFKYNEGWTYAQAIYFCFITLSTIGFGDYVADNNPDKVYPQWYSFLMASWIFFGLAWLARVINHSIDTLERINTHLKLPRSSVNDSQETQSENPGPGNQELPEEEVKVPPVI
ncbi:potassium channel subfamily K member 17-like [Aplochiton taeniatus]